METDNECVQSIINRQASYVIKTMNNSKEWAHKQSTEGVMSRDTYEDIVVMNERWIMAIKNLRDEFIEEFL